MRFEIYNFINSKKLLTLSPSQKNRAEKKNRHRNPYQKNSRNNFEINKKHNSSDFIIFATL